MIVKGREFASGKTPVICVPVMGKDLEEVMSVAKRVIAEGSQMIEWRVDYLAAWEDEEAVKACLTQLAELCADTVLLVTLRTADQGGLAQASGKALREFYLMLAKAGKADFIDVEFFGVEHPRRLLKEMKSYGARVITSHHDFHETPPAPVMEHIFEGMALGGADLAKLAVMPQSIADVLVLLSVTSSFCEHFPELPVASMAMGRLGVISRLSGEVFGSCLTFGTMGASSAPGQVSAEQLASVLDIIHENFGE